MVAGNADKHVFQTKFVSYIDQLLADAKVSAEQGVVAAQALVAEGGAELERRKIAGEAAKAELEEAVAQVKAKKAAIKELEGKEAQANTDGKAREKEAKLQQQEWKALRQRLEEAKAVDEASLQLLQQEEEGEEAKRRKAAATVADFVGEHADKVLHSGAAVALLAKPSARGSFDQKVVEAVTAVVKNRVAELSGQVAAIEPEEKHLKAEISGLWAIASCTSDAVAAAKEELAAAQQAQADKDAASGEAKQKIKEQAALVKEHEGAQAAANAKVEDVAEATSAFEGMVRPPAPAAAEEAPAGDAGEPPEKRARTEEETAN